MSARDESLVLALVQSVHRDSDVFKGDVMAEMTSLRDALIEEMRDLYNAEKQIVKALPKLAKSTSSPDLREAFETHLEETHNQVTRLEQAFELLETPAKGKPCPGMAGIIEEGSEVMQQDVDGAVLDAMLIAAAQRVEHYEIGAYGTAKAWAEALQLDDVADLLQQTLDEEKAADEKLTALAEEGINDAAKAGEESEDEEGEEQPRARRSASRRGGSRKASSRRSRKR